MTAEALLHGANSDPDSAGLLFYYAIAVARDRGDHALADAVIERALSRDTWTNPAWVHEFALQAVLADALLRNDPQAARARLGRLGAHPSDPAYPLLAEGAVLAAEGERKAAAAAVRRWCEGARSSRFGLARWRVGNDWAIDLLQLRLDSLYRGYERHGPVTRIALVAAGLLFALAGGAIAFLVTVEVARRHTPAPFGLAAIGILFGAIAAYGMSLAWRGIRGRSRIGRFARLDRIAQEAAEHAARYLPAFVLALGWWSAGSLRDFLLVRGPEASHIAWDVLALWVAWQVHVVLHEGSHALAAIVLGDHIEEIAVGPVRIHRDRGGWRAAWRPGSGLLWGGHVMSRPRRRRLAALRFAVVVLSGPAATAAFTAACALALLRFGGGLPDAVRNILHAGWIAGAISLAGSLSARRPAAGAPGTDAYLLRCFLRGDFWFTSTGLLVAGAMAEGTRACDWPVSVGELGAAAARAREDGGWASLLAFARAVDAGEMGLAAPHLEAALAVHGASPDLRRETLLQAALFEAIVRGDPGAARKRLDDARALWTDPYDALAEASVLLAEGERTRARAALLAWRVAVDAMPLAAKVCVGNHWALERLEDSLAPRRDGPAGLWSLAPSGTSLGPPDRRE